MQVIRDPSARTRRFRIGSSSRCARPDDSVQCCYQLAVRITTRVHGTTVRLTASTHRLARQPAGAGAGTPGSRSAGGGASAASRGNRDRSHPHHRRRHPGPPAGRGRWQGPVHQGDRGGAGRRHDRPRGAFRQGHADAAAGRSRDRRMPAARRCARCFHQPPARRHLPNCRAGAMVGTASLRRQAQVLRLRPDVEVVTFRGNVETRMPSLTPATVDATLLALAGLKRLGLAGAATAILGRRIPAGGRPGDHRASRLATTTHARATLSATIEGH